MKKGIHLFFVLVSFNLSVRAAFIDIGEPVPFGCPSVCPGNTIVFKIFHIQGLPAGAQVQAWLSNSSGSFLPGVGLISCNRFSLVSATGPWTNAAYTFSVDVNDLFFEITIPVTQAPGANYNIKFRSAVTPFTTGNTLNLPGGTCSGLNITPTYTPLAAVSSATIGNAQWLAHAYTWTPTTGAALTTPALIAQQIFFGQNNYKGHFIKNALSFNLNFTGSSGIGKMPGAVGVINDGTSFQCGEGYSTNYSLRFYRNENFTPGLYRFKLGSDDGARFSIDGGLTWLLDLFTEHAYDTLNTNSVFPNGVCMNGSAQLVIEYFQRPVDAQVTFKSTLLTPAISQPLNQQVCEGDNAGFTVGSAIPSAGYQWNVSNDGGITFTNIPAVVPYSGVSSASLHITGVPSSLNNNLYRCVISGICGNAFTTDSVKLSVTPLVAITAQPVPEIACVGDTVSFSVAANSTSTYQWQENKGSGFVNLSNGGIYSNVNSATLSLNGVTLTNSNSQFQCILSGCGPPVTSSTALLTFTRPILSTQPQNQEICGSKSVQLSASANNATVYQWQMSSNGGITFDNLTDNSIYQNTSGSELNIANADISFVGLLYRCLIGGCGQLVISDTAQILIRENSNEDFVPNVFTPNNDLKNDYLELNTAGLIDATGAVFNRWGQELFKWNKLADKWDGKYKGAAVNEGVYFYTVSATSVCDGKTLKKNGTVSVFK